MKDFLVFVQFCVLIHIFAVIGDELIHFNAK